MVKHLIKQKWFKEYFQCFNFKNFYPAVCVSQGMNIINLKIYKYIFLCPADEIHLSLSLIYYYYYLI